MTHEASTNLNAHFTAPIPTLRRAANFLFRLDREFQQKEHLRKLTPDQLRDIGISQGDVAEIIRNWHC